MQVEKTIAFSGYRPAKLPNQGDEKSFEIQIIKKKLLNAISQMIDKGYDTFLVGMANGFDTYAGEALVELKKKYLHIKLVCVLPFAKTGNDENRISKEYNLLTENADEVITLSENYFRGAYFVRNEYLIDNSSLLICYYDGKSGGTEHTVSYAQKKGHKIINIAHENIDIFTIFDNI